MSDPFGSTENPYRGERVDVLGTPFGWRGSPFTFFSVDVHVYVHVWTCIRVCVHVCVHTCTRVCVCIRVHVRVYECVCVTSLTAVRVCHFEKFSFGGAGETGGVDDGGRVRLNGGGSAGRLSLLRV